MQIRKMIYEDKPHIVDMMRVFYTSDAVMTNGSEVIYSDDVDACVDGDNPYAEGFVFENDSGEIIGYAMVAKSFSTEFGKKCIWLEDIYLKPEYRALGYGGIFFDKLFSLYTDVIFRLEAEAENKNAVALYKKCGFEVLPYLEMIKR